MKELAPIPPSPPIALPQTALSACHLAVIAGLEDATKAAFALLHELTRQRGEGDEWTRLPSPKSRCIVSGFSRSKIYNLVSQGKVRAKTVQGGRFYSLADVRALLRGE
jgi:hypothetical protein